MTAQISDCFRYRRQRYELAAMSAGELFDPSVFGLSPVASCTACWRGYQAVFALSGRQLVLDDLYVSLYREGTKYEPETGPVICGVNPITPKKDTMFNNHYRRLRYPLNYTGALLITRGFILELYVHMGFHPPWKYKKVIELTFENGILKAEQDRSQEMAKLRKSFLAKGSIGDWTPGEHIVDFIQRAFDRSYPEWWFF